MSNAKQETIADIVADIRAQNQGLPEDSYALSPLVCDLLSFAYRIETAYHREVAELKRKMNDVVCENEALRDACGTCGAKREREATREKSSQVGNAAKMREALSEISNLADALDIDNPNVVAILDQCRDALAEPERNCDVGTAEEQTNSYLAFCDRHTCQSCPVGFKRKTDCGFIWAQMPYEEGGAK